MYLQKNNVIENNISDISEENNFLDDYIKNYPQKYLKHIENIENIIDKHKN